MSTLFGKKRKRKATIPNAADGSVLLESASAINESVLSQDIDRIDGNDKSDDSPIHSFAGSGLLSPLVDNCHTLGLRIPTDVQRFLIPFLMKNQSDPVVALSATGTGKTAAFCLPILHHLADDPCHNFAVIVTPTRELAQQIHQQVIALGVPYAVQSALVVGGLPTPSLGAHVLVATPGRLGTLLRTAIAPRLQLTRYIVLDEADRLLSLESDFGKDIAKIVENCGELAQTVMLSATMTASLQKLNELVGPKKTLKMYVAKDVLGRQANDNKGEPTTRLKGEKSDPPPESSKRPKIPAGLVQEYLFMPDKVRDAYLLATIRTLIVNGGRVDGDEDDEQPKRKGKRHRRRKKSPSITEQDTTDSRLAKSAVIFVSTCERTALVSAMLEQVGVTNVALHSVLSQDRRLAALAKFRNHRVRILVATDIAARGLDLEHVDLVINGSVPRNPVNYVHRVGCAGSSRYIGE